MDLQVEFAKLLIRRPDLLAAYFDMKGVPVKKRPYRKHVIRNVAEKKVQLNMLTEADFNWVWTFIRGEATDTGKFIYNAEKHFKGRSTVNT